MKPFMVIVLLVFFVAVPLAEGRGLGSRSSSGTSSRARTPGIASGSPVRVKPYVKPRTGKYVSPHVRTSPNKTRLDNYSTKGNGNPYTGKKGSKNPAPLPKPKTTP